MSLKRNVLDLRKRKEIGKMHKKSKNLNAKI